MREPSSFHIMVQYLREYGYRIPSWPLDVIKYYYDWLFVGFKGMNMIGFMKYWRLKVKLNIIGNHEGKITVI